MLIWTTRFSRKKAVASIIVMGIVMAVLIVLIGRQDAASPDIPQLPDNAARIAYLESLGWEVDSEPLETLQFLLPDILSEPYLSYNKLQLSQGFDLTTCCGKQISRYTYVVHNYPGRPEGVQINLLLCDDTPVGGDVFCPGENGFQVTLAYPIQQKA